MFGVKKYDKIIINILFVLVCILYSVFVMLWMDTFNRQAVLDGTMVSLSQLKQIKALAQKRECVEIIVYALWIVLITYTWFRKRQKLIEIFKITVMLIFVMFVCCITVIIGFYIINKSWIICMNYFEPFLVIAFVMICVILLVSVRRFLSAYGKNK